MVLVNETMKGYYHATLC